MLQWTSIIRGAWPYLSRGATRIGSWIWKNKGTAAAIAIPPLIQPVASDGDIDLIISNNANTSSTNVGELISYTITVTNIGPGIAQDVDVVDSVTGDTSIVKSDPKRIFNKWSLGKMAPGNSSTLTLVVKANAPGNIINSAIVSSSSKDMNTSNNIAKAITYINEENTNMAKPLESSTPMQFDTDERNKIFRPFI